MTQLNDLLGLEPTDPEAPWEAVLYQSYFDGSRDEGPLRISLFNIEGEDGYTIPLQFTFEIRLEGIDSVSRITTPIKETSEHGSANEQVCEFIVQNFLDRSKYLPLITLEIMNGSRRVDPAKHGRLAGCFRQAYEALAGIRSIKSRA